MKRLVAVALAIAAPAACGPSDSAQGQCATDTDCGAGEVCARTDECLPASDVHSSTVTWTIRTMPASPTTCAASPDFYIQFDGPGYGDTFGFEPVPCAQGQFTVDKLPKRFQQVEIGVDGQWNQFAIIDPSTGAAAFNLYP